MEVQSDVWRGSLNAVLVVLTYFFVIFLTLVYLKNVHSIDFVEIIFDSIGAVGSPFLLDMLDFAHFLLSHVVMTAVFFGLLYALNISNNLLYLEDGDLVFRSGLFLTKLVRVDLKDVRQVYTKDYAFLKGTKELHIVPFSAEEIVVPAVPGAAEVRDKIAAFAEHRQEQDYVDDLLSDPIVSGLSV